MTGGNYFFSGSFTHEILAAPGTGEIAVRFLYQLAEQSIEDVQGLGDRVFS
jgi:hypothetical protein